MKPVSAPTWSLNHRRILFVLSLFISIAGYSQQSAFSKILYDSTNQVLEAVDITQAFDSGYIVLARPGRLIHTDRAGDPVWVRKLEIENQENYNVPEFRSVIQTRDSCFLIVGSALDNFGYNSRGIVCKADSTGQILWSSAIVDDLGIYPTAATCDHDSGFVITGITVNTRSPQLQLYDMFICRIDRKGNLVWMKRGGIDDRRNTVTSISAVEDGYIISGYFIDLSQNRKKSFLTCIDDMGDVKWSNEYYLPDMNAEEVVSLDVVGNEKGFMACLWSGHKTYLLQGDQEGLPVRMIRYDLFYYWPGYIFHPQDYLLKKDDDGYVMTLYDAYTEGRIITTDSSGTPLQNCDVYIIPSRTIETSNHELIVFGRGPLIYAKHAHSFSSYAGMIQMDSVEHNDQCYYCADWDYPSYELDTVGYKALPFSFRERGDLVPGNLISLETEMVYSMEGCVDMWGDVQEMEPEPFCRVYPNPATNSLQVETLWPLNATFTLYGISGNIFSQKVIDSGCGEIDISDLPPGLYIYSISTEDKLKASGKVIIE